MGGVTRGGWSDVNAGGARPGVKARAPPRSVGVAMAAAAERDDRTVPAAPEGERVSQSEWLSGTGGDGTSRVQRPHRGAPSKERPHCGPEGGDEGGVHAEGPRSAHTAGLAEGRDAPSSPSPRGDSPSREYRSLLDPKNIAQAKQQQCIIEAAMNSSPDRWDCLWLDILLLDIFPGSIPPPWLNNISPKLPICNAMTHSSKV